MYQQAVAPQVALLGALNTSKVRRLPCPPKRPSSSFYHQLHINKLTALNDMAPRPELGQAAERFRGYAASRPSAAGPSPTRLPSAWPCREAGGSPTFSPGARPV